MEMSEFGVQIPSLVRKDREGGDFWKSKWLFGKINGPWETKGETWEFATKSAGCASDFSKERSSELIAVTASWQLSESFWEALLLGRCRISATQMPSAQNNFYVKVTSFGASHPDPLWCILVNNIPTCQPVFFFFLGCWGLEFIVWSWATFWTRTSWIKAGMTHALLCRPLLYR